MHDECGSVHASEDQAEMIDQRASEFVRYSTARPRYFGLDGENHMCI